MFSVHRMPHFVRVATTSRSIRPQARTFALSARQAYPRVNAQDKDSIDTEATEYTKSGTDDGAARQEDAAFDPNITNPEQEKETAGKGNEKDGNPLDVSPANPDVSKQNDPKKEGATKSAKEEHGGERSGGSSGPKAG